MTERTYTKAEILKALGEERAWVDDLLSLGVISIRAASERRCGVFSTASRLGLADAYIAAAAYKDRKPEGDESPKGA